MINQFISHLNKFITLNSEEEFFLCQELKIKEYRKGQIILREGQVSKSFYFNLSGFVRLFYIKDSGEKTAYFYPKGFFISAYESFVKQVPSKLNLQVTEKTILVDISIAASQKLLEFSPKFEAIARIAMEDELINHQKIIHALLTLSPEERYYNLMSENPEIFQKVPQHQIASYIGVQPESLSRIKKRYLEKS